MTDGIGLERYRAEFTGLQFTEPEPTVLDVAVTGPNGNEVDSPTHRSLAQLWPVISTDPGVRAVLFRGADNTFSSHASAGLVQAMRTDPPTRERTMIEARDIVVNLLNCTKPIVSALEGTVGGPALAVGLLADVSVAATTANIRDGHNGHGVPAGDHAAMSWPLLCGMAKAKYYLMTSRSVSGAEAERIGLVSLCTEPEDTVRTALDLAREFAAAPTESVAWTKHTLNHWFRSMYPTFDASLMYEIYAFTRSGEQQRQLPAPDPEPATRSTTPDDGSLSSPP